MNNTSMAVILKRFDDPDDVIRFSKGKFETITLGSFTIGRATYQPGWKWSEDVAPGLDEEFCTIEHVGMVVSGTATAAIVGGQVVEMKPGDFFYVPSEPHDSWVLGDETYVSLHFLGASNYVRSD